MIKSIIVILSPCQQNCRTKQRTSPFPPGGPPRIKRPRHAASNPPSEMHLQPTEEMYRSGNGGPKICRKEAERQLVLSVKKRAAVKLPPESTLRRVHILLFRGGPFFLSSFQLRCCGSSQCRRLSHPLAHTYYHTFSCSVFLGFASVFPFARS